MLWGAHGGSLELRSDGSGARLHGVFPYGCNAVLSDGGRAGRPQKERIAPRAFAYRVEKPDEDIHLLVGHSFDAPLASKATGTLSLRDTAEALTFDAMITPEIASTSFGRDALAMIASGLAVGISPGFRIPPKRRVEKAESVEEEPVDPARGMFGAIIRTVLSALLFEVSLVTRPAYSEAQVEMRNWTPAHEAPDAGLKRVLSRWRA